MTHRRSQTRRIGRQEQYETRLQKRLPSKVFVAVEPSVAPKSLFGRNSGGLAGVRPPSASSGRAAQPDRCFWRVRQHPPERNLEGCQALNQHDLTGFSTNANAVATAVKAPRKPRRTSCSDSYLCMACHSPSGFTRKSNIRLSYQFAANCAIH